MAYADEIDLCLRWPDPGRPPPVLGGAYPAVPALLLQGEEDLRTPPEVSAHVATLIPGAQRVTVPGVGHSIVGGDPSGCGQRQLRRFLAGEPVRARCPRVETDVPATGVPPVSFGALAPATGLAGRLGRTVRAVDATLDFLELALSPAIDPDGRGGGLRGGSYRYGRRLALDGVVVVPGVRISGRENAAGTLELRVAGSARRAGADPGDGRRSAQRAARRAPGARAPGQPPAEPARVRRVGGAGGGGRAVAGAAVASGWVAAGGGSRVAGRDLRVARAAAPANVNGGIEEAGSVGGGVPAGLWKRFHRFDCRVVQPEAEEPDTRREGRRSTLHSRRISAAVSR